MIKKFVKLIVRQPPFLMRVLIIFILSVVIVSQLVIFRSQSRESVKVNEQAALVKTIPEMEQKISSSDMPVVMPIIAESMVLQGTSVQGGVFAALINGQIYKEGDNCGDYIIVKINRGAVILENRSTKEQKNLQLPSQ